MSDTPAPYATSPADATEFLVFTTTPAQVPPYTPPPPARAAAPPNAVLYPAGPWTEAQQSRLEQAQLDGFAMKKRALAAEARVQELLAELADAAEALDEAGHELEYERQTRQQTEQAMVTLAGRVSEQQAELAGQEVEKLTLLRELRQARAALHNATR